MISLKKLSVRKGEDEGEERSDPPPPQRPAREAWGVVVEPLTVGKEAVFALSFHRKGTSVYYLYRHYRNRVEADRETQRLSHDLHLDQTEFEGKYFLDSMG